MKVKMLSFKPNKDGSVTLYLDKGADLHSLIDMTGKEVTLDISIGDVIQDAQWYTIAKRAMSAVKEAYEIGKKEEQAKWQQPEEAA